ncbi:HAD-like domain-containing protein [Obelidium mucronatum]|nr:HAD-like domain-containing protein [Obelidium mucronatum]
MTYSLLALDLDGTLLTPTGQVSPRTIAAIQAVASTGTLIALCSGRATFCMTPIEAQLGLSTHLVTYNGAQGFTPSSEPMDRKQLFSHCLTDAQVDQVLKAAALLGCTVNYYDSECIHAVVVMEEHRRLCERYERQTGALYNYISSYDEVRRRRLYPSKLLIMGHNTSEIVRFLHETTTGLKIIQDDYFVECLPGHVNKGVGFRDLCEGLGVPMEQAVAFGDGLNDVEFLEAAGFGVAMLNGKQGLKDVADKVTAFTNAEDGLACEIEEMLGRGMFGGPKVVV